MAITVLVFGTFYLSQNQSADAGCIDWDGSGNCIQFDDPSPPPSVKGVCVANCDEEPSQNNVIDTTGMGKILDDDTTPAQRRACEEQYGIGYRVYDESSDECINELDACKRQFGSEYISYKASTNQCFSIQEECYFARLANDYDFVKKYCTSGDSGSSISLIFGSEGTGDGQFMSPGGMAIDSSDNIYVADSINNRIQKFDSSGNYILQFGSEGSGPGEFNAPDGIVIDRSDNIYVADSINDRIQKFDSDGMYIMQLGFESPDPAEFNPGSMAIDSSDNIYVADTFNNLIHKFDTSGEYVLQFGSEGSGPGEFRYPSSMAIDSSDNIYVADNDNHRIQKFDSSGNYILQFGSEGSGPGEFYYPISMAIDSSDNIYVADSNFRIQKFDSEGEYVLRLDLDPNKFHPGNMAIDSSDNIYVVNYVDNSIQKFEFEDSGLKSAQTKSKGSENPEIKESLTTEKSGCLIATATYGTELAPQVQLLREVRDNVLFSTNSGTMFMTGFNEFYYSFSPTIADLERQNPAFKEIIKTAITPMISTLSILNYVSIDSEVEIFGYGISIILLNIGLYFVAPIILIQKLKAYVTNKKQTKRMKEIRVDPNQSDCPYCKSDNVARISYGILHKLSEEEEKLVKNGKLVFRGCVVGVAAIFAVITEYFRPLRSKQ